MPGIVAVASQTPQAAMGGQLDGMLASMRHHTWYRLSGAVAGSSTAALGCVQLDHGDADRLFESQDHRCTVAFAGELYDAESAARALGLPTNCGFARILLEGYRRNGTEFLRTLNGSFAAAIWDEGRQRLLLTNDCFGMRPLYYAKLPGKLLAASEIKALLIDENVPRDPNRRGLAQFFTFGHFLRDDTFFSGIKTVPPAALLEYDAKNDKLSIERYWRLEAGAESKSKSPHETLDELDEAFGRAVERCIAGPRRLGLALSGGLDARSILAAIDHSRVPLKTLSMGVDGSLDLRAAAKLAELTNRDHHPFVLEANFIANFGRHLQNMVRLTDGHYLDQCIVLPTLPLYRELGIEALLRGHAGELLHMNKAYSFSLDREGLAIRNETSLRTWLQKRLSAYMLEAVDGPLLMHSTTGEMAALARDSLDECLAESAMLQPPLQRISHLFVTQRLHRETSMSLAMFGTVAEPRVPFLDRELVRLLLAAPPEMKLGDRIQSHILRKRRPEFLNVVNANTGASLQAPELVQKLATLRMRVFAKLGVRGYQPYERLGLWLRRELEPLVREILLAPACLDRGVFNPQTVRRVVDQHSKNERNHTYLLMAMMIFESGQRQLLDRHESGELADGGGREPILSARAS